MRKLQLVLILLILSSSTSCGARVSETSDSLAVKVVSEFYNWYIHEAYPKSTSYYQVPPYEKIGDENYILDTTELRVRLREVPYFSDTFIEKQVQRAGECNKAMAEISWNTEPESMFNLKPCNYLWGNQWIGGQGEKINGFKILGASAIDGRFEVLVSILIDEREFVKATVILANANSDLLIQRIELKW